MFLITSLLNLSDVSGSFRKSTEDRECYPGDGVSCSLIRWISLKYVDKWASFELL